MLKRRILETALLLSALALLVVAPVVAATVWDPQPLDEQAAPVPIVVTVGTAVTTNRTPGVAEVIAVEGRSIGWSAPSGLPGVVTDVWIAANDAVDTGTRMFRISGQEVVAYVASAPFHRALTRGDTGPDVAQLSQMMVDLGYLVDIGPAPDRYGVQLASAVLEFNAQHRDPDPRSTVFDPATVLWVGPEAPVVGNVMLRPGVVGIEPNQVVFDTAVQIEAVSVSALPDRVNPAADPTDSFSYTFTWNGLRFDISANGTELAAHETERFAAMTAGHAGPDSTEVEGTIELVTPREVLTVPASALLESSESCLLKARDDAEPPYSPNDFDPVPVSVVGGDLARTYVDANVEGAQVLANPAQIPNSKTC